MERLMYHSLIDEKYSGIITILDYEIRVTKHLTELSFPHATGCKRKAIVDLALKTGINRYRFVEFDLDDEGRIIPETDNYVLVSAEIEALANGYLRDKREIVLNSILTDARKKEILATCKEVECILTNFD